MGSQCACARCEDLCSLAEGCIGYSFACCINGQGGRCSPVANILFSKGTRPTWEPPLPFSTVGSRGVPTTGVNFEGEGLIDEWASQPTPERIITCATHDCQELHCYA